MSARATVHTVERRIRVFVCEDVDDMRRLLCLQVSRDPQLEVVGDAADGLAAVEGILRTEPDVVLLDLSMPELHGIDVMGQLQGQPEWPRFVVLTADLESSEAEAGAAGATAFLTKPASTMAVRRAVHHAAREASGTDDRRADALSTNSHGPLGTASSARGGRRVAVGAPRLSRRTRSCPARPSVVVDPRPVGPWAERALKRTIDVVAAAALLAAFLPLIVLISALVKLESRGRLLYVAERVGHKGRRLRMLKFRKMREGALGRPLTMSDDQRFTRIGGWLARTKLDELPQLWNVIRGDMSLVGPRPEDPRFVAVRQDDYAKILRTRPGITGLSQIAFAEESRILDRHDPVRHYVEGIFPAKAALDALYVTRWSLGLDLAVLGWTAVAVLFRKPVAVHRRTGRMNLRRRRSSAAAPALAERPARHPGGRPRVLILVTLAEFGGVCSYLRTLLPGLTDEFEVTVAAHGEGPLPQITEAAGARFVALRHVRRSIHPGRDWMGLLELIRLMRRVRPDIVHANSSKIGILARLAAWMTRVPVRLFAVHGWAFAAYGGRVGSLYRWADRAMRPLTTTVVCPAENARRAGIAAGTCTAAQTVVIPNAVDVQRITPRGAGNGVPTIMSVGRLQYPKDFPTLVEALGSLKAITWRARIVGDGSQRPELEGQLERLGLAQTVEITGIRAEVGRLLSEADVFVLSSKSECMPIAVLEAMAAGLPVVASDVGGIGEMIVDGETGILVPPSDPDALAAAIGRLVADAGLRLRLGRAGRARAEAEFDVGPFHSRYADLYRRELLRCGRVAPELLLPAGSSAW